MDEFIVPLGNFRGHDKQHVWSEEADAELTEVAPGTPCGEYLRRYWLPCAMLNQLGEHPYRLRVLGEDLVLFRETGGRLGVVHLHCAHRNMSLEFGIVEEGGIRCSYHGWKYGLDGTLLDTPCEPESGQLKEKVCLGAYPVVEYRGLAFIYMGPQDEQPPFPVFDTLLDPESEMVPYLIKSPCNWLQVMENAFDPFHVVYLHTRAVRTQFIDAFAELPLIEYHEREYGDFYTNTRRVGDYVWIRVHDLLLPSFTQNGAHFPVPDQSRYFGRCGLTRWVTPIDDANSMVIAWRHFRDGDDPRGLTDKTKVGYGTTDFYGQGGDRDYSQRQQDPGDYDAWVSQGEKNIHARENLSFTDRGVGKVRRKLRASIRAVADGQPAPQPVADSDGQVPTYGGDTVLHIPAAATKSGEQHEDSQRQLREIAAAVADIYRAADSLGPEDRLQSVRQSLKDYESQWS